jgi:hypothetical protein
LFERSSRCGVGKSFAIKVKWSEFPGLILLERTLSSVLAIWHGDASKYFREAKGGI